MKSFKEYKELEEKIVSGENRPSLSLRMVEEMLKDIKKISGPVMFKGLRTQRTIALASTFKKEFNWYGLDTSKSTHLKEVHIVKQIVRKLGFKYPPVFCSAYMPGTFQFGSTHMIIPRGKYRILWSPKVKDILYNVVMHGMSSAAFKANDKRPEPKSLLDVIVSKDSGYIDYDKRAEMQHKGLIDYLADSYKELKKAPKRYEVLLDTKEYWIISVDDMEHIASMAGLNMQWNDYTYDDLEKLLKAAQANMKRNNGVLPTYGDD